MAGGAKPVGGDGTGPSASSLCVGGRHSATKRSWSTKRGLDVALPDLNRPTKQQLEHAIEGHVLGKTELVGTYHRG